MKIPTFGKIFFMKYYDKLLHVCAGLIIFFLLGLPLVIIIAAAKEGFDWWYHGKPDLLDFIATITIPVIIWLSI